MKRENLAIKLYRLLGSNDDERFWRFILIVVLALGTISVVTVCGFHTKSIHLEYNRTVNK